ncbi:hypothetical protein [Sphingosinicella terrae]|uniref:hypothetical protein n=1 Tax=Sphingosinicella terrae TaxID=2172047 RepID=UPI000E0D0357|nr:hypothetical protein [Sphingosinicella terrae]
MNPTEQQELRRRTAALPLEAIEEAAGPVAGDRKDDFVELILAAHLVADEGRSALQRCIDAGRRAGLSWSEVGAVLGISKQAAQQRFGSGGAAFSGCDGADVEIRLGATAFNEMRILENEGRAGRELVGIGMLTLYFRRTMQQWEHARLIGISSAPPPRGSGPEWQHVTSWFPFHYFKRRLAAPALSEEE